jgi:hypothetical protein
VWIFFAVNHLSPGIHTAAQATPGEHTAKVVMFWGSIVGALISLITLLFALFSEKGVSRRLCVSGSFAALLLWVPAIIVLSESLAVYSIYHP